MKNNSQKTHKTCQRCGECCLRGGPAIHEADAELITNGDIPLTRLYTIRPGERAYDNVGGGLFQVTTDIIKIKSRDGASACVFYDDSAQACGIYEKRPMECRLQACWDSTPLQDAYTGDRLSRKEILVNSRWLRELIDAHEARCHFEFIYPLVEGREEGDTSAAAELTGIVNYDAHFRDVAVSKGQMPAELMDFLLGRPLAEILQKQFGIKINRT